MKITDRRALSTQGSDIDLVLEIESAPGGALVLSSRHAGSQRHSIERIELKTDLRVDEVVEHGWQSWSTVRATSTGDVRPERAEAPRWFRHQMLADGDAAGRVLSADEVLVHPGGVLGNLDVGGYPVTFSVTDTGEVSISILLDGIELEPGQELELPSLVSLEGAPGSALATWASLTGERRTPRPPRPQPLGWCSWYQYFTDITAEDVRINLAEAARHGLELVQIDDGWQPSIGEWDRTNDRFGAPIGDLASEITDAGLVAGIWTAPFLAIEGGPLARAHPEWLVTNENGAPRTVMIHGLWGGRVFALDTSRPDVIDHLITTFSRLRAQGFDYFKIDFLYAAAMPGGRQASGTQTRSQALRAGLEAVRAGIGEDAYLLGCGCPLAPAIGIVDAMRVSEDVAPHWEPGIAFDGWKESSVGTVNAVEQSIRRASLHRRWFALDPDCALLRAHTTALSSQERRALAATVAGTGGFTVVSDNLTTYGTDEWDLLATLGELRSLVDTPLEVIDPLARDRLGLFGGNHRLEVELSSAAASLEVGPHRVF